MHHCTECKTELESEFPSGGIAFHPRDFGYYGGYWDNEPWVDTTDAERVVLCQGCTERLVSAFPSILRTVKDSWDTRAEGRFPA